MYMLIYVTERQLGELLFLDNQNAAFGVDQTHELLVNKLEELALQSNPDFDSSRAAVTGEWRVVSDDYVDRTCISVTVHPVDHEDEITPIDEVDEGFVEVVLWNDDEFVPDMAIEDCENPW